MSPQSSRTCKNASKQLRLKETRTSEGETETLNGCVGTLASFKSPLGVAERSHQRLVGSCFFSFFFLEVDLLLLPPSCRDHHLNRTANVSHGERSRCPCASTRRYDTPSIATMIHVNVASCEDVLFLALRSLDGCTVSECGSVCVISSDALCASRLDTSRLAA
eukprot:6057292-Amphidinium_carterae.1